jgi:hypothetical protein
LEVFVPGRCANGLVVRAALPLSPEDSEFELAHISPKERSELGPSQSTIRSEFDKDARSDDECERVFPGLIEDRLD